MNHQLINYKYLKLYKFWLIKDLFPDLTIIINYYLHKLTEFRLLIPPKIELVNPIYIDETGIMFKIKQITKDTQFYKYYVWFKEDKIDRISLLYRSGNVHTPIRVKLVKSSVNDIVIEGNYLRVDDLVISDEIKIKL